MPCAKNKYADQPANPRSLISAFVVLCIDSKLSKMFDILAKQAGLSLQDQDQDSLLVKRRNDNHSPGPVIRELVPSSHQRSELSNTILCVFNR